MKNPKPHRKPWERHQSKTFITDESLTQQSHKESVDVNNIVARFARTGILPPGQGNPVYGDVTAFAKPFQEAIDAAGITIEQARDFAANWEPPKAAEQESVQPPEEPDGGTE